MYEHFFGFNEPPFNLTPDPRFLFLSQQHKEALASLLYGIQERKGFVVLTGEVGSGKTTICRTLFQELDPSRTQLALILNSLLTEVELLQAINEEFALPSTSTSKKELLQVLNGFLLRENAQGRNVILIIDEAQNLPFPTLELIRMISNLETETEKLIQIVLVGQPELQDILRRPELEQLRQRLAVRYHIAPLNREEMETYIRRRLEVAGAKVQIDWTAGALDRLYQLTRGVPRKINVLCDRALLAAYVESTYSITERLINKAADELGESEPAEPLPALPADATSEKHAAGKPAAFLSALQIKAIAAAAAFVVVVVLAAVALSIYWVNRQQQAMLERMFPRTAQSAAPAAPNSESAGAVIPVVSAKALLNDPNTRIQPGEPPGPLSERPTPTPPPAQPAEADGAGPSGEHRRARPPVPAYRFDWEYDDNGVLRVADGQFAESSAFFNLLALWNIRFDAEEFRRFSPDRLRNFPYERSTMDLRREVWAVEWRKAVRLNIPFIAGWNDPRGRLSPYVVVRRVEGQMVTILDGVHGLLSLGRDQIEPYFHMAVFYYFDPEGITGLAPGASGDAVTALQEKLLVMKVFQGRATGQFDAGTQRAVRQVQKSFGLDETGEVDRLTACVIQSHSRPDRPVLWEQGGYDEP
ncbi:MAG: hypothetical protein Kow0059_00630 [Candidatus Sumerlaeia bacterium]